MIIFRGNPNTKNESFRSIYLSLNRVNFQYLFGIVSIFVLSKVLNAKNYQYEKFGF